MLKKLSVLLMALTLSFGVLASCGNDDKAKDDKKEEPKQTEQKKDDAEEPEKPGESGFKEINIGEEKQIGPYNVAAVYFQPVDMYPAGKNPSKDDSDMHLEADIHLQKDAAKKFGFGDGDNIWPAYLTVKYNVIDKDGKAVAEGSFMPMNADDGPHYGANIKKGLIKVGKYTLKLTIDAPKDYLLHTDDETGVPAKEGAKDYFKTQTAEFEWNYTGEQLQNQ